MAAAVGAFQVRSPIAGTLVVNATTSGETVEEGEALFTVLDGDRIWLEAHIFEPDIPRVEGALGAWFTVEGYDEPFDVDANDGRLVTLGRVVDPRDAHRAGHLRGRQPRPAACASGSSPRSRSPPARACALATPRVGAGRRRRQGPVVYVQVEGEAFERRPLAWASATERLGRGARGRRAGERVVTRGAYEIKLASSASIADPAHGHVH